MYIRKVKQTNKGSGKEYCTYRIVRTYRSADGKVRQEALLNLGANFTLSQERWKELADRVEEIISGQQTLLPAEEEVEKLAQNIAKRITHRISSVAAEDKTPAIKAENEDYHTVDVNSLQHINLRQIGAEHVGYEALKSLQLKELLQELNFNHKQIDIAFGSILGRLIAPGSERATHKYLQSQSALDELLGCDFQQLSLDQLYRISDKLLCHKETIEKRLFQREKMLFHFDEVITLYDLTNTYFEGRCLLNAKAAYGRSKEKRRDCPLVTLALVLDASGFPKKSEVFAGNTSEPGTLAQMISRLEGEAKPMVVMDAGIASEENLEWLKTNGYTYIVVSRKHKELIPDETGVILQHKKDYLIKAKLIKNTGTGESELYCLSALKAEKERSMQSQAATRYEAGLEKIKSGLKKKNASKGYEKILERLGRLKEKYKYVGYTYEVEVVTDNSGKNIADIRWSSLETKQKTPGVYCLRSNCQDLDEQTLWDIYIMLTELESAFRSLKSELGLRPIYHQITQRVDSHIFISILAYHVLHTIRYQLKQHGITDSWETIRGDLRTHCRITSTVNRKDGKKLHIRKTSLANPRQTKIYQALSITTAPGKIEKCVL